MYFRIVILIFFVFQSSCRQKEESKVELREQNKQELEENNLAISEILFYSRSYGLVNPNTITKKRRISISKNNIYEIYEEQKDSVFIKKDTSKIIETNAKIKMLISNIPKKFLNENKSFGSPNLVDEGSLGVSIKLIDNRNIFWEFSYRKNEHPEDIRPYYEMFLDIEEQLKEIE